MKLGQHDLIRHTLVPLGESEYLDKVDLFKPKIGPVIATIVKLVHSDILDLIKGSLWLSYP